MRGFTDVYHTGYTFLLCNMHAVRTVNQLCVSFVYLISAETQSSLSKTHHVIIL